jgi:dTDP-4-amino-4,6-dideoxygalactose transaminase
MIAFNKPYLTGKEVEYIVEALNKQTSGNGDFTRKSQAFLAAKYDFKKVLLTTSCTDALEIAALLLDIKPGDEVIVPSFTFVSTANAFALRGAKIVFADSSPDHPNIDVSLLATLITPQTKAIVVVHYAGVAVDMDPVMELAARNNIFVVEDAAQAINSYYKLKPLGSIGHIGCFSFHDTKNIICGEGGALLINDERFISRAEIIWEKGTNRAAFIRGEVDKYGWVDVGSSFLPSEVTAAFLLAQLESIDSIHEKRMKAFNYYQQEFQKFLPACGLTLPPVPGFSLHNAHIFYLLCFNLEQRNHLISILKKQDIQAFFHYPPLHLSRFFLQTNKPKPLPNAIKFFEQVIRLPLYVGLSENEQDYIIKTIKSAMDTLLLDTLES